MQHPVLDISKEALTYSICFIPAVCAWLRIDEFCLCSTGSEKNGVFQCVCVCVGGGLFLPSSCPVSYPTTVHSLLSSHLLLFSLLTVLSCREDGNVRITCTLIRQQSWDHLEWIGEDGWIGGLYRGRRMWAQMEPLHEEVEAGGRRREVQPKQTEGAQSFALASVTDYFQLRVKECYCWAASSNPPTRHPHWWTGNLLFIPQPSPHSSFFPHSCPSPSLAEQTLGCRAIQAFYDLMMGMDGAKKKKGSS